MAMSNNQSCSSIKDFYSYGYFWYFHIVLAANINSYPPLMLIHTVGGASETEALSLAIVICQLSVGVNKTPNT